MNKPVIYLCGFDYMGADNVIEFKNAQNYLEGLGYEVINPYVVSFPIKQDNFKTAVEYKNARDKACIKKMLDADFVVLMPGFTNGGRSLVEFDLCKFVSLSTVALNKIKPAICM
jgi:hypothetical protein